MAYLYGYLTCCTFKLNQLDSNVSKRGLIYTVRAMQVLHINWEQCVRTLLLPGFMFVYTTLGVMGFYGLVKLPGIGAIKMGVAALYCFTYLLVVFGAGGRLEESSEQFLKNWSSKCKLMKSKQGEQKSARAEIKFIRSIRGFRVYVGNAFYVEKFTILRIANVLITTTVTCILM